MTCRTRIKNSRTSPAELQVCHGILGFMSSAESTLATDDSARACAWAERLAGLGRVDQARKVLRATLDNRCGYVPAVLALARLEISAGSAASAADLLQQFLRDYPADRECGCLLAETLLEQGRVAEAATVIRDFISVDTTSRELAGRICQAQGRHRDAVRVLGPRSSLSREGRRLRRRSWWRSGGPVNITARRTFVLVRRAASSDVHVPEQPDELLEKATWAEWLAGQGRREEARSFLIQALADDGRHPLLLRCLGQIENDDGARATALFLWREASDASPGDMDTIAALSLLLATTTATDALIKRSDDALRVLETYVDQSDPRIRAARAEALRAAGAAPSVVVAAYGGRAGLQARDLRRRRRLWLRSAGPIGQLRVRCSRYLQGESSRHALPRTEAESEEIARALDSLAGTDPSAAREHLEEAMRNHGRTPSLLLAYADIDGPDNADWHCLTLAAEAARSVPNSIDTACALAWAVRWTLGYESAVQVLTGLPEGQRQATECRVLLGNLHRAAGNNASAFAAYPPALALDRYDRRARRSCGWKAAVPGRRRRRRGQYAPVDLAEFDPLPAGIARVMDEADRCGDDVTAAGALLAAAAGDHARHPLLLLRLARLERQRGDRHAGGALAAEAVSAEPGDALTAAIGISELTAAGYVRTALKTAESARPALAANALFRALTGDLYWSWGFPAKAVAAYGGFDYQPYRRWRRRSSWWRSGSVFTRIRETAARQEDDLQPELRRPVPEPAGLTALGLDPAVAAAVREDLAAYQVTLTVRGDNRPELGRAWLDWRYFLPAWTLLMLAVFSFAEQRRWPAAGIAGDLAAAAVAAGGAACLYWLVDNLVRTRVTGWLLIFAGCAGAAVAFMSAGRWQFTAGLALSGSVCGGLTVMAASTVITVVSRLRLARWQRRNAETVVLDGMLKLIAAVSAPLVRRDAETRQASVDSLERIAVRVQRDFPHAVHSQDARSQRTFANRAQAAAAELRDMKQGVALPDEPSRQGVLKQLKELATALARGSFEDWPPPRPAADEQKVKRPLWWHALQAGRTVLLILVPPLAAWFVPLAEGLAWLRTVSVIWAILVVLVALDPAIGKRLTKMREVLSLLKDAAPTRDTGFAGIREQGDSDDKRELAQEAPGHDPLRTALQAHPPSRTTASRPG